MTLDINFGSDVAVIEDYRYIEGEDVTAEPKPENKLEYESLERMPAEEYDVCDKEYTIWPKDAYRSGTWDFKEFFETYLPRLYNRYYREDREALKASRPSRCIYPVTEYIDDINNLGSVAPVNEGFPGLYEDRVKWLKHWANKCIETYGEAAKFSMS